MDRNVSCAPIARTKITLRLLAARRWSKSDGNEADVEVARAIPSVVLLLQHQRAASGAAAVVIATASATKAKLLYSIPLGVAARRKAIRRSAAVDTSNSAVKRAIGAR